MKTGIYSSDVFGNIIEFQCKVTKGLPSVQIVGLASKSIDEAKDRVRAAFHSAGLDFPKGRVLVNLSPADLPKEGSSYDLPIAISILQASGQIRPLNSKIFAVGEMSLDGLVLPVKGIIGRISKCPKDISAVLVSSDNYWQAKKATDKRVIPIQSIRNFVEILSGLSSPNIPKDASPTRLATNYDDAFSEIRGQELAKRAIILAASGHHNVLLYGPPGTGKSMLAKAFVSLLPNLSESEQLQTTHIHSLRDYSKDEMLVRPPLRAPHHSSSNVSIIGGGAKAKPGEISLAHNGVLFLDELLEFPRSCIEALRQPLEDREIHISRAEHSITYPASFTLIATMNPCPCGNLGSSKPCTCTAYAIESYQKRLSGPVLDRIDICIKVDEVPIDSLLKEIKPEPIQDLRDKIEATLRLQHERNGGKYNSELSNKQIRNIKIDNDARLLLDSAATKMKLSPRSYFRALRVARTIADLDKRDEITTSDIAECLQYRQFTHSN